MDKKEKLAAVMDDKWNSVTDKYTIKGLLGSGSYGTVVEAIHKDSGETVAIKLITKINKTSYTARKVLREITILRKLSESSNNLYTIKLLDVILPTGVTENSIDDLDHIFLVTTYHQYDLKAFLTSK